MIKIIANAGHQEGDGKESQLNIEIRDELKKIKPDIVCVPDELGLKESINWINEQKINIANSFAISIHINANNDKTIRGVEAYWDDDPKYAKVFARQVAGEMKIPNRGAKHDSISYFGSLGFLRKLECPSVIVECGYATNIMDTIAFKNNGAEKAAQGIKNAIDELFGDNCEHEEELEKQRNIIQILIDFIVSLFSKRKVGLAV